MPKVSRKSLLISTALFALLAGAASAKPTSLIEEGPMLAQDSSRVGNYSYMRDRRNGYDPRYQIPGTVYREEYKVDRSQPVHPAGPNDPRFQNGNDPNYENPYLDPRYRDAYIRDPNAWVNRNQRYDANGNPLDPYVDQNGNTHTVVGGTQRTYYDSQGNRVRVPQPGQTYYDASGRPAVYQTPQAYDRNGNPINNNGQAYYNNQPAYNGGGNPANGDDRYYQVGPFKVRY